MDNKNRKVTNKLPYIGLSNSHIIDSARTQPLIKVNKIVSGHFRLSVLPRKAISNIISFRLQSSFN